MIFSLPDFKVIKAIKQTTPNETNNQTAPLNDPSKVSMTKPIVKGAIKPATCIPKLTTPTAEPPWGAVYFGYAFFTSYPFYLIIDQYQMHRDEMELTLRQVLR